MLKEILGKLRDRFGNVKMRTLLVLIGAIVAIVFFVFFTTSSDEQNAAVTADVTPQRIGEIESLPGAGEHNQEYEALQLAENLRKAEEAKKSGGSAVARLINPADENQPTLGFGQEECETCLYDKDGYNKDGYDAQGYDRDGYNRAGFDRFGYDRDGYDKDGFDRNGCNRQGLNREGKPCYDVNGYTAEGYDKFGFNKEGIDAKGFNQEGFDSTGFDREGYGKDGYDKDGYDRDGYDRDGFDKDGYDRDGYDRDGFNRQGCNREGLNRQGLPCESPVPEVVAPIEGTNKQTQEAYQRLLDEEKKREQQQLAELAEQQRLAQLAEERARQQAFEALLQQQAHSILGATWKPTTQTYVGGILTSAETMAGGEGGLGSGGSSTGMPSNAPVLHKAGEIVFAVLETSLNSDEPGPVLARVVSGPLAGAKVLGELERQKDKLYLAFKILSATNLPESIEINAVAVDPETARTAMATDVDNHYFLRYGTLFASAFLAGVGEAVQSGLGSPNLEVVDGVVVGESVQATTREQVLVGLGEIGNKVGEEIDYFNVPPTVTLDSGTSIGLLMLADLKLDKSSAPISAQDYTAGAVGTNPPKQPQTAPEAIQKGATPSTPMPQGATVIETFEGK